MNKFVPVLFLSAVLFATSVFAQDKPSVIAVVSTFYKHYNFDQDGTIRLKFQKRKEGWYTAEENLTQPNTYAKQQLFWSVDQGKYLTLSYHPAKDTDDITVAGAVDSYYQFGGEKEYNEYQYDRNIYFGYPGWDWDVIQEYGLREHLTDTLLESLSRAYSNYAIGFFYDQYGELSTNYDTDREKLPDNQLIPESRKNKFLMYEKKAIETLQRLVSQNPHYQTMVGGSPVKYANENMFAYSSLLFTGYEKEAMSFIRPNLYPDSLIQRAHQYLDSVVPKGILITTGDNDTYPIWYVQLNQHYRTDVIAINYSLLGLRRCLNYLDKHYMGSLFSTPASIYNKANFDYALFDDMNVCKQPQLLAPFMDSVNVSDRQKEARDGDRTMFYVMDTTRKYHCKDLIIPLKNGKKESSSTGGFLQLKLRDYLLMNDYLLLDLFNTNLHKRAVYFTDKDEQGLFAKYLTRTGTVYRINTN